jgi:hypothetical protein
MKISFVEMIVHYVVVALFDIFEIYSVNLPEMTNR